MSTEDLADLISAGGLSDHTKSIAEQELSSRPGEPVEMATNDVAADALDAVVESQRPKPARSFVVRLWRGDVRLVATYWLFGFVGSWVVGIGGLIIDTTLIGFLGPDDFVAKSGGLIISAFHWAVYPVFVSIAIWRSANKYQGWRQWRILAKLVIVIGIAVASIAVIAHTVEFLRA